MGVGELVADHQQGGLPFVPGGLEDVLHRGVGPDRGHGDDPLVGVGAAHAVQLPLVRVGHHDALAAGGGGDVTQGGVHLSLHNENFVDLGAGPQGLDHRVAALDDSVGRGLVPCPVRAGLVVFVLHKTPIPARRPKEEISGKKSREPAYFRYYIMDFREEKAPFPGKFQEREFRSRFRQPRPPGQGENFINS